MRFGVVILGAGASRRMGRPKLTLPWNGGVVVGHLVRQWRELGAAQVAIVLSNDNRALLDALDQLGFDEDQRIENPDPERGMFSSIQCAAGWVGWKSGLSHAVVTLGDQPHLKRSTLESLITAAEEKADRICQPAYGGRPKHPVVVPWADFEELNSTELPTFAHFLRERDPRRHLVKADDAGLTVDIDTPDDYRRALELIR